MVSAVLVAVAVAVLIGGSVVLWRFEIRYAADVQTVTSPTGQRYDILVHRDGVMLYSKREGMFNTNSIFPTVIALIRRWRRGPWRWAVTVRRSRFHGYPDLLRDVVDDHPTAHERAREIARRLESGELMWPRNWES